MSPVHPSRRRADAFAAAVEQPAPAGLDARTAALVGLVGALREAATVAPAARPGHVADLRERLLAAAATDLVPAAPEPRRSAVAPPTTTRVRERRLAVAIGALAVVGATTSMAVASQSALPGEVLYPVKRALENADTRFSADDQRGPALLSHASGRLTELDGLARRSGGAETVDLPTEVAMVDTLDTFADQADQASDVLLERWSETGDEASVSELKEFAGASIGRLAALEGALPDAVRPAVLDAAQVLFVIDQAATEACPECAGTGITEIPTSLTSAEVLVPPTAEPTEPSEQVDPPSVAAVPSTAPSAPASPRRTPSSTAPSAPVPTTPAPAPTRTPGPVDPTRVAQPVVPSVNVPTPTRSRGVLGEVGELIGGITGTNPGPGAPTTAPTNLGEVLGGVLDSTLGTVGGVLGQQP